MSTSREELIALAERMRGYVQARGGPAKDDDGKYIGTCWPMILEAADVLDRLAATPKAGVNATDDSLAKTVTTAVLSALKAGGDNLTIFNAVKQALPSVSGGVDQQETQTTKPSPSRAEDTATETATDAERERCAEIVQMARAGEIDRDFRAIISVIEGGMTIEQIKEFCT